MEARTGTVAAYDEAAGFGTIAEDDGPERWFHCTAIADGSRTIEVGARVRYDVVAGRMGRWEAAGIQPAGGATRP
jgi:cold shock protein